MDGRIVSALSPFTPLEQRLEYCRAHPGRPWINLVENLPVWDDPSVLGGLNRQAGQLDAYEPCAGIETLIEQLCARDAALYNVPIQERNVLVTCGALHAISLIARHFSRSGLVALCQRPLLLNIDNLLRNCGYQVQFFDAAYPVEDFRRQLHLQAGKLGLVFLNSPNNPSGELCSAELMAEAAGHCMQASIPLVVDQVYDAFGDETTRLSSPFTFSNDWNHLFTVNSVSKNYGAPGLRVGWLVSSAENRAQLAGRLEQEMICLPGITQHCAVELLKHGNSELVAKVRRQKEIVKTLLARVPAITYQDPPAGVQYWIKLPMSDSEAFADRALQNQSLVLTTSSNFAGAENGFVRIPVGAEMKLIREALGALKVAIEEQL